MNLSGFYCHIRDIDSIVFIMRFLAALRIHNGQAVLRPNGLKAFRLNIRSSSGGTYEVLPDKSLRAKVFAARRVQNL